MSKGLELAITVAWMRHWSHMFSFSNLLNKIPQGRGSEQRLSRVLWGRAKRLYRE